jgi:hypothetical protein
MVIDWYVWINGAQRGPLSSEMLRQLAGRGNLSPETLLKQGKAGTWYRAGELRRLFAPAIAAEAQPRPWRQDVVETGHWLIPAVHRTDLIFAKSPSRIPRSVRPANAAGQFGRTALIAMLWSFAAVFALGCVFFARSIHAERRAKVAAANYQIAQAVARADEWIVGNSPADGEAIERRLADVLADEDATEKAKGESVLVQVHNRCKQIAAKKRFPEATAKIGGAFGMKLGEVFNPADAAGGPSTAGNDATYEFSPRIPYQAFRRYYVLVTPKTHRIYCIGATGDFKNVAAAKKEQVVLFRLLQQKYGGDQETGPADASNDAKRINRGNRSVAIKVDGLFGVAMEIEYFDKPLAEAAEKERIELAAKVVELGAL